MQHAHSHLELTQKGHSLPVHQNRAPPHTLCMWGMGAWKRSHPASLPSQAGSGAAAQMARKIPLSQFHITLKALEGGVQA